MRFIDYSRWFRDREKVGIWQPNLQYNELNKKSQVAGMFAFKLVQLLKLNKVKFT